MTATSEEKRKLRAELERIEKLMATSRQASQDIVKPHYSRKMNHGQVERVVDRMQHLMDNDRTTRHEWLLGVAEPFRYIKDLPALVDNGAVLVSDEDSERKFQFLNTVFPAANSAGNAFVTVSPDSWGSDTGEGAQFICEDGYGAPIWYSKDDYSSTSTKSANSSMAGTPSTLNSALQNLGDMPAGLGSTNKYHNMAVGIAVQPLASSSTDQGEITVVCTRNPTLYPVDGVTLSTVLSYPRDQVLIRTALIKHWSGPIQDELNAGGPGSTHASENYLMMPALPYSSEYFDAKTVTPDGNNNPLTSYLGAKTAKAPILAVFVSGAADASVFKTVIVHNYAIGLASGNEVSSDSVPLGTATKATVFGDLHMLHTQVRPGGGRSFLRSTSSQKFPDGVSASRAFALSENKRSPGFLKRAWAAVKKKGKGFVKSQGGIASLLSKAVMTLIPMIL